MGYSFERIKRIICLRLVEHFPLLNGKKRAVLAKMGGVKVKDENCTFIGEGVIFDSLYPANIEIGAHVHVTMGCIFLTHSLDTSISHGIVWKQSRIKIGEYAFIGARTIICSNVEIGENSIIGAGSVVTKNIPPNEIWAGNPARFIKKRK